MNELPPAPHKLGDIDLYPSSLVREIVAAERDAERERCAQIVENYNPGGSYYIIRSVLLAAIRASAPAPSEDKP